MSAKIEKCRRCGARAETIDNLVGSSFFGLFRKETTTTTVERVRFRARYYVRNEERDQVSVVNEDQPLCGDCWGELIGRFMQGRSVVALPGKEGRS